MKRVAALLVIILDKEGDVQSVNYVFKDLAFCTLCAWYTIPVIDGSIFLPTIVHKYEGIFSSRVDINSARHVRKRSIAKDLLTAHE